MNAFCASENFDAFIVLRSSQPGITPENSNQKQSRIPASEHEERKTPGRCAECAGHGRCPHLTFGNLDAFRNNPTAPFAAVYNIAVEAACLEMMQKFFQRIFFSP